MITLRAYGGKYANYNKKKKKKKMKEKYKIENSST